jgi:aspartyl-tRNA(Asn)/glutamyl-tRNA(Gln) amidotransferase subunit C
MKISREDVLRVAELAHLELSPAEVDTYRAQIDQILGYIDKLNQLDVANVQPMSQVIFPGEGSAQAHPELRDDVLVDCNTAEKVFAGAADSQRPFFRVPKVIER